MVHKKLSKILSLILSLLLVANQFLLATAVFANETELAATPSATLAPPTTLESSPSAAPIFTPPPTPQPVWTNSDGVYTTETLQLDKAYHFPPNEKVSLTFTKLLEGSGTVTVKEHEVPQTVENAGSKDYEITSSMPNGNFSFDLTLPTNDPTKKVLSSNDGQNYGPVSNETQTSQDIITIKGITHLTHFIVADSTADFNHVVVNEFFVDGTAEWIELYNPTGAEIDLTDWVLDDNGGSLTTHTIGTDSTTTTIPAKGFLVVEDNFGLNDTSPFDTVRLIDPIGTLFDSRSYTSDPGSSSIGRIVDGGSDWMTFANPTRDVSNGATLNTLYVDDGFTGPDLDGGHTWGFDAFNRIQDAINHAPAGSTINVAAGTYEESITIAKSLTLSGAGSGTTTIDGCGDVITITAGNVTVKGFTLTDSNCGGGSIVYIGSSIQSINIEGNIIRDGENGIYTNGSTNTTIQGNEMRGNTYGVYLTGDVGGSEIKNNNIHDNGQGISANGASFSTLSISGNQITNSNDRYGIYFNAISGSVLTISQNQITGGNDSGIYLSGGGAQISGSTVTISQNTVSSNSSHGIYADVIVNSTLNVSNNTVGANDGNGIYLCAAGQCNNNSILRIKGNSISGNSNSGISLYEIYASTVTIGGEAQGDRNTITNNGSSGIYIQYIGTPQDPSNVTILNNTISSNSDSGIYLQNFDSVSTVSANQNNILENDGGGVQNNDGEDFFDATLNFWGDASGPLDENLNPNGLGNRVSGRVLFSPFYTDSARSTLTEIEFNASNINLANFDDWGIFDLSEEGEDLVRFVDLLQQFEFKVGENGGENDIVLPEGVRIERSDDLEFDWDSLSLQDVAESLMSGFDSTIAIVDAIQWGLPGIELEFSTPITVRIFVGTALNGRTLNVVRSTSGSGGWTSTGIVAPGTCTVTEGICTFQATLASYFAATQQVAVSSGGGQALSQAGGSVAAPTCNDTKPGSAPALLSAASGVNKIALGWSKAQDPVTYYLVTYGLGPGLQQYGNPNIGGKDTTSYTVDGLSGGTTYYFRVRAGNGCAPGSFSNELSAKPKGSLVTVVPAPGFTAGVLGITPTPPPSVQPEVESPQPAVSPKPASANILSIFSAIWGFFSRLFGI